MYKKRNRMIKKITSLSDTGFFHIFGSSVINKIIAFLSNIIVVRIITKAEFGEYSYALNIVSFALLFSGLGLVTGTFQLCSEKKDLNEKKQIFNYASLMGIRFNILLSAIIACIAIFWDMPMEGAKKLLLFMTFYPVVTIVFEFQQIFLRSCFRNKDYSYASMINTIIVMIASIAGAWICGAKGLIFGRYLAYIFTAVCIVKLFKVTFSTKKTDIFYEDKKALFHISIIGMLSNGLGELLYLIDVFVLGLITTEEMVASYKVATVIPSACTFIPLAIVTYVYPYFASHRDDPQWCMQKYKMMIKYVALLNISISLFLVFFAKPIITIIYGEEYLDAVPCFIILSISYFFSGTFRILSGNLLATQRKFTFNLVVNILCGIINLAGNIVLIPLFYSMGAAMTTFMVVIVSSIISTTYYLYILKRK